ncbi:MAG: ACP S-malonyltransferase [Planctomycetota bacterium]
MSTSDPTPQTSAFILCPGQGSQHVGMGQAWFDQFPVARQTFAAADEALGIKLSELCFQGPDDELNRTDVAQAAIYTTSVACYQALIEAEMIAPPAAVAGLSLGEFTALHLAGAMSFADGLKLVRLRGQAMQDAADAAPPSTMVALTGTATEDHIQALCDRALAACPDDAVLVPANYNSPMQTVLSGTTAACEKAAELAPDAGVKATVLTVAGAFHSPIMQPAADRLAAALDQVDWSAPRCPVIANVTAKPHDADPESIKKLLVSQLTSPVRWSQSMLAAAADHADLAFHELAPGKVLAGLMRRIDKSIKVIPHPSPD